MVVNLGKSLKVGIISDQPYSTSLGYSIRPKEFAENLNERGCEVHFFSPKNGNESVSGVNLYSPEIKLPISQYGIYNNIRRAFKTKYLASMFYRKKTLSFLSNQFYERIINKIKKLNLDILQGEKEISSKTALLIGKELKIPVVSDIHGLMIEEAIQHGFFKDKSKNYYECKEYIQDIFLNSDKIIFVSDYMKKYFQDHYDINIKKIHVVNNAARYRKNVSN